MSRTGAASGRIRAAAVALALAVAACGPQAGDERRGGKIIVREPPRGAIKVDDDLYMVYIGIDDGGCRMFSAWSDTRAVVAAVYYRDAENSFTLLRSRADCGK